MNNDLRNLRLDDDIFFDQIILDLIQNGIPRQLYVRSDHFNGMSERLFFQHFRLTKATVLLVLHEIEHRLEYLHNLNNSVSPINQLLICLRFYATGCHQLSLAYFGGMHKSTVNRIIKRVTEALCYLAPQYIKIPGIEDRPRIHQKFHERAAFPRVIAAIDCTHIKIQSPGGNDAELFRNRKGYFSLNVQAAVDPFYKIVNLVARWPGSTHDSTIFANSRLRADIETNGFPNCFLLGDSGYAVRKYLLTPLLETRTEAERRYNESHIRTRVIVENTFGIWKRRFPVLAYGSRVRLDLIKNIIIATAILHNIAREAGEENPPEEHDNPALFEDLLNQANIAPVNIDNDHNNNSGFQVRRQLIENYFAHL